MKKPVEWVCEHGVTFRIGGDIPEGARCKDYHKPLPRVDTADEDKIVLMRCARVLSNPPQRRTGISDEYFIKEYDEMTKQDLSLEEFRWHEKVYRKFHEKQTQEKEGE